MLTVDQVEGQEGQEVQEPAPEEECLEEEAGSDLRPRCGLFGLFGVWVFEIIFF